ncbi:MAG: leucyl aminopeptidase family protein [Hyphomicrobiales bacterium]
MVVTPQTLDGVLKSLAPDARAWAMAAGFKGETGRALPMPGAKGGVSGILFGLGDPSTADPFLPGKLARLLPEGAYAFASDTGNARLAALGWLLEAYDFARYRKAQRPPARLACPAGVEREDLVSEASAVWQVRDLVNTPANDLGPDEIEAAARALAKAHGAKIVVTKGEALRRGFPLIHAVGQGSPRAPRLIDITTGPARAPKVTLVGKGVCFDTGGLDIKPSSNMLLMKKDMGGAASVLGLAALILRAKLKVRLRVLIPTVENAVSGSSFRPGDVFRSRKGLTVEIGNTDAEGRLILADALALADDEKPDLLVDMATLTGAARVALGPDLPPFYTDDDALAADLHRHGLAQNDPLWRMPFWRPYNGLFESKIADINNAGSSGFAGSITAALFLKRFVEQAQRYVHFDIFAWVPVAKPGRPMGGEAQAIRALFALLQERYGR